MHSHTGSILTSLNSGLSEGEPIGMDVTKNYLTIFTMEGYLKVYELTDSPTKLVTPVRNLYDMISDFGEIIQAKTNSSGNKVAITLAAANLIPDGKLYIWDMETDNILIYDFHKYDIPNNEYEFEHFGNEDNADKPNVDTDEIKKNFDEICKNRIPLNLSWDSEDPRLLVCSTRKIKMAIAKKGFLPRSKSSTGMTLFFTINNDSSYFKISFMHVLW